MDTISVLASILGGASGGAIATAIIWTRLHYLEKKLEETHRMVMRLYYPTIEERREK